MHEWALAESVIKTISGILKEKGMTGRKAVICVGEFQGIDIEIFSFALKEIAAGAGLKTDFKIETIKTRFKCKSCGNEWTFDDIKKDLGDIESEDIHFIPEVIFAHSRCPKCRGIGFEIVEGRGIFIERIE